MNRDTKEELFFVTTVIVAVIIATVAFSAVAGFAMWLFGVPIQCLFVHCIQSAPGEITITST